MSALWSTGIRNFQQNFGSFKQAISGGKMCIYQGTMPTDPDAAIVGTLLVTCTTSGGALTSAVAPRWSLKATVDGTITSLTINSIELISATIAATGTIADTLAAAATNINAFNPSVRYKAYVSGTDTLIIEGMPFVGAQDFIIAHTGTITATVKKPSEATQGSRLGVASVNGIQVGASVAGVLSTSGVWQGTCVATGSANFFVIYGNTNDDTGGADASPYHARRIIGTCGTSGADYIMASTALTINHTHSVDTSTITIGATS